MNKAAILYIQCLKNGPIHSFANNNEFIISYILAYNINFQS